MYEHMQDTRPIISVTIQLDALNMTCMQSLSARVISLCCLTQLDVHAYAAMKARSSCCRAVTPICLASGRQHGALLHKTCMCVSCRLLRRPGRSRRPLLQQLDHQIADLDGQLAQQGASQPTGKGSRPVACGRGQNDCNTSLAYIAGSQRLVHLAGQSRCLPMEAGCPSAGMLGLAQAPACADNPSPCWR